MGDLIIEPIGPDGWPLWRELRLAALAGDAHAFGSRLADWQDADESRWRARLESSTNFIARLRGIPAGMASGAVKTETEGMGELMSFWVAPAARAQSWTATRCSSLSRTGHGRTVWPGCACTYGRPTHRRSAPTSAPGSATPALFPPIRRSG